MTFLSSEKLPFILHLSIGLLSVLLLTECDKIRLVGPSRCSGRVEVYHRDSWGTVCDDHWSILNAEVVCRELNCGAVLDAKKGAFFGEGKDSIWLDDVQCVGNESTILKCPHKPLGSNNCDHNEDAGVVCSDNARLVNGSNRCSGRVEIFHNGQWKHACSGDWSKDEATALCRDINCGSPSIQPAMPKFGESQLKAVKANCVGNETVISECALQDFEEACADAVTVCTNSKPIRLANGTNRCSGRVEIYHEKRWGTICDDRWGMQDAIVTCREMNCGQALAVKYRAYFGQGQEQVWLDDVECTGHETTIGDCSHRGFGENDCDHNEDAGVICSETVRLVNGSDTCSGRIEIFQNNVWGKVCYDNWGQREASILCQELNCGAPKKSQETFNYGDTMLPAFTARCTSDVGSLSQCDIRPRTGTCQAVSVACAGLPPLRLVNGTNQCSGRVEVLHDGTWGTVCDDDWDIRDAQVVCRAMDCGTAQTAKSSAYFGMGDGNIWLDDVQCVGNETSLLNCQRPAFGETNCGHAEDAGVICSDTIRLMNGTDQCSGRVEFKHGGHWHPAFNINWGTNEATVVCREMNCGDPVAFSGSFGQIGARTGYRITCLGRENSLSQCALSEYTRESHVMEVSIKCSGNVKFVGGSSRCVGRVEFYDKGQWGTICADSWDINDAMVVCKQMDCGKAHKISAVDAFGQGTGHTWLDQVECTGSESTLSQCRQSQYIGRVCNATSVAGVICSGSLEARLVDGKDDCTGRVEVRRGETWSTVCDTDWTVSKAEAVCDLLECGRAMTAPGASHFGAGTGPVVEATDSCFGNMTFLKQCSLDGFRPSKCSHEHDAGVLCAAQIRLVDGPSTCSGRVEVFYKSEWGTVCDDEWGMPDADVVCRQLGCGHAVSAPHSAHFGRGTGPIWLDNMDCGGQESALSHCSHPKFGVNNCGHSEDASVICLGALQKPQITISPSNQVNWGDKVEITCTVVSERVGGTFTLKTTQGSFHKEKFSEHEAATFFFPAVDFVNRGSYFCEYQKKLSNQVVNYPQGNAIDLSVSVTLDKPNIFLTSPHAMLIYSPEKVSINRGNTLSVTCSTYSRYPGGFFHLMKADTNTSEIKPAFGHFTYYTASFDFPLIDYVHQGEYTCIYGVNISSLSFCSAPSKSLQVTVAASSSSSATTAVIIVLFLLVVLLGVGYLYWKKKWRGTGVLVQFSNRFGGAIKRDTDDRSNGMLDSRDRNNPMYDSAVSRSFEDKTAEEPAESEQAAEGGSEDLAGKVCYELEPLVVS